MVSTWRFYSFKDIDLRARQPFQLVILLGLLFAGGVGVLAVGAVYHRAGVHVFRGFLASAMDFPAQA